VSVVLRLPGDKSISHRVAMLAGVAAGCCRVANFNSGADCASTLRCMRQLGAKIARPDGLTLEIEPARPASRPSRALDCGNSGSTIRMLAGLLCGWNIPATLTGDESLRRRPMARIADPLRQMGAVIELQEDRFAPMIIRDGVKRPIVYRPPVASAQVKSAILLAGLAQPGTRVLESVSTRDHTERLLSVLGITSQHIPAFRYDVPGDPSSAAFFVVAAIVRGVELLLEHVLVNPLRISYLHVLKQAGARIEIRNQCTLQNEPVGDIHVMPGGRLQSMHIDATLAPAVIDEIPALAVAGASAGFSVEGASELRAKESDRIAALVGNLQAAGLSVQEQEDGFRSSPGILRPIQCQTFGDHRIAMAFATAGLEPDDRACVGISLPEFWELLDKVRND
jgi:3-phosphoshikimate 1-carboxyvinyltransferase